MKTTRHLLPQLVSRVSDWSRPSAVQLLAGPSQTELDPGNADSATGVQLRAGRPLRLLLRQPLYEVYGRVSSEDDGSHLFEALDGSVDKREHVFVVQVAVVLRQSEVLLRCPMSREYPRDAVVIAT